MPWPTCPHTVTGLSPRAARTYGLQVKLLKCLVDNLVVDVSFNQMGGLFTYAFLESVNDKYTPSHLLKLSIILVRHSTRARSTRRRAARLLCMWGC